MLSLLRKKRLLSVISLSLIITSLSWIFPYQFPLLQVKKAEANTTYDANPQIKGGYYHTLALTSDGKIKAWGYNAYGQLGNGTTTNSTTPVQVIGITGVTTITAGGYHSLALTSDGKVWAWGHNTYGQLGNGTTTHSSVPVQVTGITGTVIAVAAGAYHSLALTSDGKVWSWGYNDHGQLGNGTTTSSTTPVEVTSLTGATAIAAGGLYTLALTPDGKAWAWGFNGDGELGNGDTKNSKTPVQVIGLTGATAIAAGGYHSLALTPDGEVWAWGYNADGELGNGTTTNSSVPVQIIDIASPTVSITSPADGSLISNNTPQLSYTATDTGSGVASVVVTVDGEVVNKISGDNLDPLSDGQHTVAVTASDAAENSTTATSTFTVDATAPTVSATPAGGIYNSSQSVSLSASEPASIYYTTDGTTPAASSDCYIGLPIDILTTATLKFIAIDTAGNQSQIYAESYVIDTAPPTTSMETLPASPDGQNGWFITMPTITLSSNETSTIYYQWGSTSTAGWQTYSTSINALQGEHELYYYSADTAGNKEDIKSQIIKVDDVAPEVIATGPTDLATDVSVSDSIKATFSESIDTSTLSSLTYMVKDSCGNSVLGSITYDASTKVATFKPDANLAYSTTYTATVTNAIKDIAGNNMAASKSWSFTTSVSPDAEPPVTNLTTNPTSPDGQNGWFITVPTITLSSNETSTIYYQWDSTSTAGWQTYSTTIDALEGDHTIYFYSVDEAGNTEEVKSKSIKADTVAPAAFDLISPADNYETDDPQPVFSWSASSDSGSSLAGYRLYIDDTVAVDNIGSDQTSLQLPFNLTPGSHSWYVIAFDAAGNIKQSSSTRTVTAVDDILPTASELTPTGVVYDYMPTISAVLYDTWSGIDPASVVMNLDGAPTFASFNSTTGVVSYSPSTMLSRGKHYVELSFSDVAGNQSTATWDFIVYGTPVSGTISQDTTWTVEDSPYIVMDSIIVDKGVTLTIEPGTVIKFADQTWDESPFQVEATLKAEGTPAQKIYFTSFKDDSIGGDTNGDGGASSPAAGDWDEIGLFWSVNTVLDYCVVSYSGRGYEAVAIDGGSPSITNSVIKHSLNAGISIYSDVIAPHIHYCDIYDIVPWLSYNGYAILADDYSPYVDARYNWFGTSNSPSGKIYGPVNYSPWSAVPYSSGGGLISQRTYGSRSHSGYAGEPVNTSSGNFTYEAQDISLPGKGLALNFTRNYNSQDALNNGPVGYGWTHNYNTSLRFDPESTVTVFYPEGKRETFAYAGSNNYNSPEGVLEKLNKNTDGTYTLTFVNQDKFNYDASGRLTGQADKYGNTTSLTYDSDGYLNSIANPGSRSLTFTYTNGRITKVQDNAGRFIEYGYDAAGNLTTVKDLNGKTTTYTYDSGHQLLTIQEPKPSQNPFLTQVI